MHRSSALQAIALLTIIVQGCRQAANPRGFVTSCADLPGRLPADLAIQYQIHDYDRPDALARFVLFDSRRPCPPDEMPAHLLTFYRKQVCVPLPAAVVGHLFDELRRERIDHIRTRPLQSGPHTAGRMITLKWDNHQCSVGDVLGLVEVAPEQRESLRKISEAVAETIRSAR